MLTVGDIFYYGTRGVARDQAQALHYFERAAHAGDASGMCGAANMYLKGKCNDSMGARNPQGAEFEI
jgi:TPR repeat protein